MFTQAEFNKLDTPSTQPLALSPCLCVKWRKHTANHTLWNVPFFYLHHHPPPPPPQRWQESEPSIYCQRPLKNEIQTLVDVFSAPLKKNRRDPNFVQTLLCKNIPSLGGCGQKMECPFRPSVVAKKLCWWLKIKLRWLKEGAKCLILLTEVPVVLYRVIISQKSSWWSPLF